MRGRFGAPKGIDGEEMHTPRTDHDLDHLDPVSAVMRYCCGGFVYEHTYNHL